MLTFASAFLAFVTFDHVTNKHSSGLIPYEFSPAKDQRILPSSIPDEEVIFPPSTIGQSQKPVAFLIGIFSSDIGKYANRRSYIRDTYLSLEDPRICKLGEYIKQTKENSNNVQCMIPYTFVVSAGGKDRPTDHNDHEPLILDTDLNGNIDSEGDVTYLNIRENMEDGKSPTWFKYAANVAKEFGIDYIGKIDDDSVLSPELLFEFISTELPPSPFNRRIYGGSSWATFAKNVVYGAGQFYFMSSDLADFVGNTLTAKDRLGLQHKRHTEDADMGAFVFSNPRPIKFLNLSQYRMWIHPKKQELDFRNTWGSIHQLPHAARRGLPLDYLCQEWMRGGGV